MIDFNSSAGQIARRLLDSEYVVWLTTVDSQGAPQPRPVWFIWDGDAVLVYSEPNAAKVAQMRNNPRVALHFNSDHEANSNVLVMAATAALPANPTPALQVPAYMDKYTQGIFDLESTPEQFSGAYSVAIRITPLRLRGF